jgi:phosphoglycolate phosphatase
MTIFPFDIIGFDLDGTLLDTSGDLTHATNHALALAGRAPLTHEQVKPMIGLGAKHMLERGLEATGGIPADDFKPLYRALLKHYEAQIAVETRPYPGLLDVLAQFDARGVKYGIVTNKFESLAVRLLGELDLLDRMAFVIGGDTLGKENSKPSAAPIHEMIARAGGGRAAYIGDTIHDVMAARNAGIPSIAVSFGFSLCPAHELGADAVIDHYDLLIGALSALPLRR